MAHSIRRRVVPWQRGCRTAQMEMHDASSSIGHEAVNSVSASGASMESHRVARVADGVPHAAAADALSTPTHNARGDTCTAVAASNASSAIVLAPSTACVPVGEPDGGCDRCRGNHGFHHTCAKERNRPDYGSRERSKRQRTVQHPLALPPPAPASENQALTQKPASDELPLQLPFGFACGSKFCCPRQDCYAPAATRVCLIRTDSSHQAT